MRKLLLTVLFAGAFMVSCTSFQRISNEKDDNLVVIDAINGMSYILDKTTHLCFTVIQNSVTDVPCCNVRKIEKARDYISWLTDDDCKNVK